MAGVRRSAMPSGRWHPPVGLMVEAPIGDLEQTAAVHVHDGDVASPSAFERANTICDPSGDHAGSKHPNEFGSEKGPPHAGVIGSSCAELPSAFTTQISLWSSEALVSSKIWLPSGDHAPAGSTWRSGGDTRCSPDPSRLVTKIPVAPSSVDRKNTSRVPSGE